VLRDAQDARGATLNNDAAARRCFKYSISYLFILFGVLVLDHLVLT